MVQLEWGKTMFIENNTKLLNNNNKWIKTNKLI